MDDIIPKKLLNSKLEELNEEDMNTSVFGSKLIALLFTASWCSPCAILEKELAEIYTEANIGDKTLEIMSISFDKSEDTFKKSTINKPWLFTPFNEAGSKNLVEKFGIIAVPVLIILSQSGEVITETGRKEIMEEGIRAVDRWVMKS